MREIDRDTLKRWAISIVQEVEPDDVFVVDDGFDALAQDWHRAEAHDEGRFIGGPEIATFAPMIVPFLLGLFGDVIKDVVTDQAKKAVGTLLDRVLQRKATGDEAERLRGEINAAVEKSRFSSAQKAELRAGFATMFSKLAPAHEAS